VQNGKDLFAHCKIRLNFVSSWALLPFRVHTIFSPKVSPCADDKIDVWRNPSGKGGEAETVIARRLLAKLTVRKNRVGQKAENT
jgi:hypothetical protein